MPNRTSQATRDSISTWSRAVGAALGASGILYEFTYDNLHNPGIIYACAVLMGIFPPVAQSVMFSIMAWLHSKDIDLRIGRDGLALRIKPVFPIAPPPPARVTTLVAPIEDVAEPTLPLSPTSRGPTLPESDSPTFPSKSPESSSEC